MLLLSRSPSGPENRGCSKRRKATGHRQQEESSFCNLDVRRCCVIRITKSQITHKRSFFAIPRFERSKLFCTMQYFYYLFHSRLKTGLTGARRLVYCRAKVKLSRETEKLSFSLSHHCSQHRPPVFFHPGATTTSKTMSFCLFMKYE